MSKAQPARAGVIVAVEDDATMRTFIKDFLSLHGHTVTTAVGISDGLALCEAVRPDVVIVDMVLRPGNGVTLIRALRGARPRPRIVAISGAGTADGFDLLLEAREAGADVTLRKPIPGAFLAEVVGDLLSN